MSLATGLKTCALCIVKFETTDLLKQQSVTRYDVSSGNSFWLWVVIGTGVQRSGDARASAWLHAPLPNSSIEQWCMVFIVTGYMLFVVSQYDAIFTFPKQHFYEVCRHSMHIILHALFKPKLQTLKLIFVVFPPVTVAPSADLPMLVFRAIKSLNWNQFFNFNTLRVPTSTEILAYEVMIGHYFCKDWARESVKTSSDVGDKAASCKVGWAQLWRRCDVVSWKINVSRFLKTVFA